MDANQFIADRFNLDLKQKSPIEIPNYGRDNLPVLMNELGYTVGAEVGVLIGKYSEMFCRNIPKLKLYAIDSWEIYDGYNIFDKLPKAYEEAKRRLALYNVEIIRAFSMDAVKMFQDESLDFVYIDANHSYLHAVQDIVYWAEKVRKGGIVAGHDYRHSGPANGSHSVIEAIWGYTQAYHIRPWFILGTKAEVPGMIRDRTRSWMFIK